MAIDSRNGREPAAQLQEKVDSADEGGIRAAADGVEQAATSSSGHREALSAAASELDGVWEDSAATMYVSYLQRLSTAGGDLEDRLTDTATTLRDVADVVQLMQQAVADRLDEADTEADGIARDQEAEAGAADAAEDPPKSSDQIRSEANAAIAQVYEAARADIQSKIDQVETKLMAAADALGADVPPRYSEEETPQPDGTPPPERQRPPGGQEDPGPSGPTGSGGPSGDGGGPGGLGPSGGPPSGPPPGNVEEWIREAIRILQENGIPVTEDDIGKIWTIIEKESGGNPNAINLWDSNAQKGIPSKGLMQTIDPTFQAHKLPGYDDIYDPVSNIIAGVRYTFDRYGGFDGHPGLQGIEAGTGYVGY